MENMVSIIGHVFHFSKQDLESLKIEEVAIWYKRAGFVLENFMNKGF